MPDHDIDGRLKQSPSLPVKRASLLGLEPQLEGQVYHTSRGYEVVLREHRLGVLYFYSFGLASAHGTFARKEVTHSSRVPVSVSVTKGCIHIT